MAKRKLTPMQQPTSTPEASETARPSRVVRGHMNGQLRTAERASVRAEVNEDISIEIRRGRVPVDLRPEQIGESVGSDRSNAWQGSAEFENLKENIRERGQTQPIRVRPAEAGWSPDPENPFFIDPEAAFVIQSGRRRLEACRQLGINVQAFISAEIDLDLEVADLEERYFENAAREDLSAFDRLLSVATIHEKAPAGTNQAVTGQRLGVSQAYVSTAVKTLKLRESVEGNLDTATASYTEIKEFLFGGAEEGQGGRAKKPTAARPKPAQREFQAGGAGRVRIKSTKTGLNLSVQRLKLAGDRQDEFETELRELLEKYAGE